MEAQELPEEGSKEVQTSEEIACFQSKKVGLCKGRREQATSSIDVTKYSIPRRLFPSQYQSSFGSKSEQIPDVSAQQCLCKEMVR